MTATYTFDVFATLDGYGSYAPPGDWGGYWGKQGPELLEHRCRLYGGGQRVVLGGTTFREFDAMLTGAPEDSGVHDDWVGLMTGSPVTVVSSTMPEPRGWPNVTVAPGDGVEVVRALKEESDVPLRSHGSLSLNHALMSAGLVDLVQVTIFPVLTGTTGTTPVFRGAADFDLELVSQRTLDGSTQELVFRPTLHPLPSLVA